MTYLKIIITSIVLYILLLQINLKMLEKRIDFLVENIDKYWGCTRLADMLPSKYEDNTLQIKEKSTERTAPFFCAGSYRPFCRRYFGYPSQFGSTVLP